VTRLRGYRLNELSQTRTDPLNDRRLSPINQEHSNANPRRHRQHCDSHRRPPTVQLSERTKWVLK
jgi:hypothetical protein